MHSDQLIRLEQYLKELPTLDTEPEVIRKACLYVGWQLRSPNSWQYRNIWTGEESEVELKSLIEAVNEKQKTIQNLKDYEANRVGNAYKQSTGSHSTNGKATKAIPKR